MTQGAFRHEVTGIVILEHEQFFKGRDVRVFVKSRYKLKAGEVVNCTTNGKKCAARIKMVTSSVGSRGKVILTLALNI